MKKNKLKNNPSPYLDHSDHSFVWNCNYLKGCNKPSYFHLCTPSTNGKHVYICEDHLNDYLGYSENLIDVKKLAITSRFI